MPLLTTKCRICSEFRGQTVSCKMPLEICHPPAIARERAAGGHRPSRVGFAHPTPLAKKLTESVAVSPVRLRVFSGALQTAVVKLLLSCLCEQVYMWDEFRIPPYKPLVADCHSRSKYCTHSPVIARERAAGGLRTTSVGCSHPTLLAKKVGCIGGCRPEYECFKEP